MNHLHSEDLAKAVEIQLQYEDGPKLSRMEVIVNWRSIEK